MIQTLMAMDSAEIIDAHQLSLWRYLRFLGADAESAEDLAQEVFVRVLSKPFNYIDQARTSAYLRTVARNLFINAAKAGRRHTSLEQLTELEDAWVRNDGENPQPHREALDACLEQLPEKSRNVLKAYYSAEDARADFAARLKMSDEALKKLLWRMREALRQCVEKRLSHA